jgi:hypothetical protein
MEDINEKCFGSFGWRQFWQNRIDILSEYDRLKGLNKNQPVKISHGVALEAKIRDWLSSFLPKKYAVTSGYIIPDIVVDDYLLRHFDVIIYNQLDAPVLWIDDNLDTSINGQKKAIPAKYVQCVIEIKATLSKTHISDSIQKLSELNQLKEYLPPTFSCSSIFAEIANDTANNLKVLEPFVNCSQIFGYRGSLILRSNADTTTSGLITINKSEKGDNLFSDIVLAKPIDNLNIYINHEGHLKIAEQFGGAELCKTSDSNWSVTKLYTPHITKNGIDVSLTWSHNSFTRFFIQTINFLEGIPTDKEDKLNFGQIYDRIQRKND